MNERSLTIKYIIAVEKVNRIYKFAFVGIMPAITGFEPIITEW